MANVILEEVSPLLFYPSCAGLHPLDAISGWRRCVLCEQSVLDDPLEKDRLWYYDHAEGLDVCEYCLEEYLHESAPSR